MAGRRTPQVIGPATDSCSSTLDRPTDPGVERQRSRRPTGRPATAGRTGEARESARDRRPPAADTASRRRSIGHEQRRQSRASAGWRRSGDDGTAGVHGRVGGSHVEHGLGEEPATSRASGAAIGTATRIDGATMDATGSTSSTAKAAASSTCRTAARLRCAPAGRRRAPTPGRWSPWQNRCANERPTRTCMAYGCFLSLRTRSISALRVSRSSSVHDPSVTRAVIICFSDPPKNVCTYCCSAVRLAAAGEIVAE